MTLSQHLTRKMGIPPSATAETFTSGKCRRPIPVARPEVRIALIAATMDPQVAAIDVLHGATSLIGFDGVMIERADGRFALIVEVAPLTHSGTAGARDAQLRGLGLTPLVLRPADLAAQERYLTARRIWLHRNARVPTSVRLQVIHLLAEGGRSLGELLGELRADIDPLPAVFAMACNGEIAIELDAILGPASKVGSLA